MKKLGPLLAVGAVLAGCGSLLGVGDDDAPPDRADASLDSATSYDATGPGDASDGAADVTTSLDAGADADADTGAAPTSPRIAFVTKGSFDSNQGRAHYDTECQNDATAAGYVGTFVAFMSTTASDAVDRLPAGVPWYLPLGNGLVSGTRVFANKGAISTTLFPEVPIKRLADGNDAAISFLVWTGTNNNGRVATNCGNWMDTTVTGTSGRANSNTATWVASTNNESCAMPGRVYCFQL